MTNGKQILRLIGYPHIHQESPYHIRSIFIRLQLDKNNLKFTKIYAAFDLMSHILE